jgi:hypothetical protein
MRSSNLLWIILVFFSGTVLAADEKTEKQNKYQARLDFVSKFAGEPKNSIPYLRNYDFEPLGNNALLLKESTNKAYLLSLDDGCNNLTKSTAISVNYRGSSINTKFDSVRVTSGRNNMSEKCFINQIQPVDVQAMKAAEDAIRESIKKAKKSD